MSWELSTSECMCHRTQEQARRSCCKNALQKKKWTILQYSQHLCVLLNKYLSWPNRKFLHDLTAISLIIFNAHLAQCIEVQASAFQGSQGEMESLLHLSQKKQLNQGFQSRRLHIEKEPHLNWSLSGLAQIWGCSNASFTSQRNTTK